MFDEASEESVFPLCSKNSWRVSRMSLSASEASAISCTCDRLRLMKMELRALRHSVGSTTKRFFPPLPHAFPTGAETIAGGPDAQALAAAGGLLDPSVTTSTPLLLPDSDEKTLAKLRKKAAASDSSSGLRLSSEFVKRASLKDSSCHKDCMMTFKKQLYSPFGLSSPLPRSLAEISPFFSRASPCDAPQTFPYSLVPKLCSGLR
mmetsp:Transcript_26983/g.88235  ORF Transcript_26983/g.88235 Transcript_26983/m.88235 type:complete len:205 (-) Transcript_26983:1414-2028(-)